MRAIVDGLRPEFTDKLELVYVDAGTESGMKRLQELGGRSHPYTVVTDANGAILWSYVGGLNEEQIRQKMIEFSLAD